ncbi:MAG: hypothetical protein H0T78_02515 [Longispora sp.]|nr:hypothetical protein [Longispora sp. (in: high G+C Gram-positive bacteria)]
MWCSALTVFALTSCGATNGPPPNSQARSSLPASAPHTPTPTTAHTHATSDTHDDPVYAPPTNGVADPAALAVIKGFAQAWARPDAAAATWRREITSWCEPALAQSFQSTDPARVPASAITGSPIPIGTPGPLSVTATVATDAGTLAVTTMRTPAGWKVSALTFTRLTK